MMKHAMIRGGLEFLYFTGAHIGLQPFVGGAGAILTLHHACGRHTLTNSSTTGS